MALEIRGQPLVWQALKESTLYTATKPRAIPPSDSDTRPTLKFLFEYATWVRSQRSKAKRFTYEGVQYGIVWVGTRLHLALSATKRARFIHPHRIKNNMKTSKRKAAGGYHTTTTAIEKYKANVAPGRKQRLIVRKGCATFHLSLICRAGAENTVSEQEVYSATSSAVFSRSKFMVLNVKVLSIRKDGSMACSMFSPPSRSSRAPEKRMGWFFQSRQGAETMTTVNTTTTPKAAHLGNPPALCTNTIERQQAIENALSTALYFIRLPSTESGLRAATSRAIRAASMLKQACAESTISGGA